MRSNSDIQDLNLTIQLKMGSEYEVKNPFGTAFDLSIDLAYLHLESSSDPLPASPFANLWSPEQAAFYAPKKGLWLSSKGDSLLIKVGYGRKDIALSNLECTQFFLKFPTWRTIKLLHCALCLFT